MRPFSEWAFEKSKTSLSSKIKIADCREFVPPYVIEQLIKLHEYASLLFEIFRPSRETMQHTSFDRLNPPSILRLLSRITLRIHASI